MSRLLGLLPLLGWMLLSSGCAMCCAPFDYDYPYVGGRWVRHNPSSGRVGSAFDEAGGPVDALPADAVIREGTAVEQVPTPAPPQPMPPGARSVIPRTLGETYLPAP